MAGFKPLVQVGREGITKKGRSGSDPSCPGGDRGMFAEVKKLSCDSIAARV